MNRGAFYFVAIVALAASIFAASTVSPDDCGGSFSIIGGQCIFIDPFLSASWDEAKFFCEEINSDLVSIDDIDFYIAILEYVRANALGNRDYWVGGKDDVEGVWLWVNGQRVDMGSPFWAVYGLSDSAYIQEPTDSAAVDVDCLRLDSGRALYFDDANCSSINSVICQRSA